jgi:hypothetical protein
MLLPKVKLSYMEPGQGPAGKAVQLVNGVVTGTESVQAPASVRISALTQDDDLYGFVGSKIRNQLLTPKSLLR